MFPLRKGERETYLSARHFGIQFLDEICTPEFTRTSQSRSRGAALQQHRPRGNVLAHPSRTMTKSPRWDRYQTCKRVTARCATWCLRLTNFRNICATLSELLGPCFPPKLAWIKEGVCCRLLFPSSPTQVSGTESKKLIIK